MKHTDVVSLVTALKERKMCRTSSSNIDREEEREEVMLVVVKMKSSASEFTSVKSVHSMIHLHLV